MEIKKSNIKENVATGASTAVGAASGVVIGASITPESANASEISSDEIDVVTENSTNSEATQTEIADNQQIGEETIEVVDSVPNNANDPIVETRNEPEVEMVGYERATNDDGSQIDIAVVKIDGQEVGFIDADMDGRADFIASDLNGNGQMDEGEVAYIADQNIGMQQFQDAADFNPLYAQNDMPDYVNDADVDTYMA